MNNTLRLIGKIYGDIILKLNNIDNIHVNDIIKHELGIGTDLEDENYYIITSISDLYIKLICLTYTNTEYGSEFYVGDIKELYLPCNHSYRIFKIVNISKIYSSNILYRKNIRTIPTFIFFSLILIVFSIIILYQVLEPSIFIYYFFASILTTHSIIYNLYF